jgi:crotonobetainyl-CoA:carnitine CoA-transferase CaiB-like acyl-CoA transferase
VVEPQSEENRVYTEKERSSGPLAGIRVLDMSRVLAGPLCGQILADLGADVIKVERPGSGDDSRAWGPPFASDENGKVTSESAFYCSCNRGKRSITIDTSKPEGQALIRQLATNSDILLENYKVGTLKKWGLDYASLSKINPQLIYCSITGFGQTGPYAPRPGYDTIIQALGGLMSVTGRRDGEPGGGPLRVGIAAIDFMTALYATIGVVAALNHRTNTGKGQCLDLSLLEVEISSLTNVAMNFLLTGVVPTRRGNRLPTIAPSDAYRCKDGHLMIIIGNDGQFRNFCAAADLPSMAEDARFRNNAIRMQNVDSLAEEMEVGLAKRTVKEWVAILGDANVPCAPIQTIKDVFDDPHVRERGAVVELQHPLIGKLPTIVNPLRFSSSPVQYDRPPPLLGEHTHEILRDVLNLGAEQIAAIEKSGTI